MVETTEDFMTPRPPIQAGGGLPAAPPAAAPEPQPAPTQSPVMSQEEIQRLVSERQGVTDTAVGNIQTLSAERMRLAGQPTPRPGMPQYGNIPKAPQPDYRNVFKESTPGLIFATVMGSMMSRKAGMGAMAAATGYMEGFAKGDKERMENERQKWRDNVEQVVKQNQVESQRYDAVWNDAKLSQTDKIAKIQAIAASIGDQQTIAGLKTGDIDFAQKLLSDRTKAVQHLKEAEIKAGGIFGGIGADHQQAIEKLGWTADAIDAAARTYNKTGQMPKNLGSRQYAGMISGAIQQRATALLKEEGKTPEDRAKGWQTYKSEQGAINAFLGQGKRGDTVRSLGVVVDHLDTMKELVDGLKNGNLQVANHIKNRIAEQTGKPAPSNVHAAAQIVGPEVVKALGVAGAGTQAERNEVKHMFGFAKSPTQYEGAISVAQKLLAGQMQGLRYQFAGSTGLPPERFDELVSPRAREFLAPKPAQAVPAASPAPAVGGGDGWSVTPVQ